jgi:hypothetical protein
LKHNDDCSISGEIGVTTWNSSHDFIPICHDDYFNEAAALVLCRELGYHHSAILNPVDAGISSKSKYNFM